MSSAGQQLVAGRIPGERIATTVETSDSSTFTAETEIISVTAALVDGRTYRIRATGHGSSTVDNDDMLLRLREDNTTGNNLQLDIMELDADNQSVTGQSWPPMEVEYTAISTGSKTFVLTAARQSGTGNLQLRAASDRPAYMYVDYIRG